MKGKFWAALCAVAVFLCSLTMVACSSASAEQKPSLAGLISDVEVYTINDFSIIMQSGLIKDEAGSERADAIYRSSHMAFAERRDLKPTEPELSLVGYVIYCLQSIESDVEMLSKITIADKCNAKCVYTCYAIEQKDTKNFYMLFAYESKDYFYCIQFVCNEKDKDTFALAFRLWADTVVINENSSSLSY